MTEEMSPGGGGHGAPEEALFVPGVDLVSPWRDAKAVADEVNEALAELGYDTRLIQAVPHVGARGEPMVRFYVEGARVVARRLRGEVVPGARVVRFERLADEREGELRHGAA